MQCITPTAALGNWQQCLWRFSTHQQLGHQGWLQRVVAGRGWSNAVVCSRVATLIPVIITLPSSLPDGDSPPACGQHVAFKLCTCAFGVLRAVHVQRCLCCWMAPCAAEFCHQPACTRLGRCTAACCVSQSPLAACTTFADQLAGLGEVGEHGLRQLCMGQRLCSAYEMFLKQRRQLLRMLLAWQLCNRVISADVVDRMLLLC
jgi:hypothetical protein